MGKKLTRKKTAAKTAKFKATMAAKRAAKEGLTGNALAFPPAIDAEAKRQVRAKLRHVVRRLPDSKDPVRQLAAEMLRLMAKFMEG